MSPVRLRPHDASRSWPAAHNRGQGKPAPETLDEAEELRRTSAMRWSGRCRVVTLPVQLKTLARLEPGQGGDRARPVQHRVRRIGLLLRSGLPLANRNQREHQRRAPLMRLRGTDLSALSHDDFDAGCRRHRQCAVPCASRNTCPRTGKRAPTPSVGSHSPQDPHPRGSALNCSLGRRRLGSAWRPLHRPVREME